MGCAKEVGIQRMCDVEDMGMLKRQSMKKLQGCGIGEHMEETGITNIRGYWTGWDMKAGIQNK